MMADDGPRRLPPQPTAVQVSIPQPMVPEVTLLWEGEESVYWKPTTPGSKAANSRQPHTAVLPLAAHTNTVPATGSQQSTAHKTAASGVPTAAGNCAASVDHSARSIPVVNGSAGQTRSSGYLPRTGVVQSSGEREYPPNFRPPSVVDHLTVLQRPSTASVTENNLRYSNNLTSNMSQCSNVVGQLSKALGNGEARSRTKISNFASGMGQQCEQVHLTDLQHRTSSSNMHLHDNLGSNAGNVGTLSAAGPRVNCNSTAASGVMFNNESAVPSSRPRVYGQHSSPAELEHRERFVHGAQAKSHYDNIENANFSEAKISSQEVRRGLSPEDTRIRHNDDMVQIPAFSNSQEVAYNPLLYSSEKKKPLQEKNTNWYKDEDRTPVASRESRAIVPRAVDFDSATPIEYRNRLANKENVYPEHPYKSTPDNLRNDQYQETNKEITPYRGLPSRSPVIVSTPDPFLQKIIEGKDQQIFQLHRVLETILSKNDNNDRTSSQSSFSASPRPIVHKEVSTQTTEHYQNCVGSRDVGINTELSWPELLESLSRSRNGDAGRCVRDVNGPSTILKNPSSVKSVVMQKSSNTSSVRFETDSDRAIDSGYALATREKVQSGAVCYNEGRPALQATRVERELRQFNGCSQPRKASRACSVETQYNTAKHDDEREEHNMDERGTYPADRCSQRGKNGCGSQREVSLTLREVVLTTIEEGPDSPQSSLHLDLSDYPGDTILPNNPRAISAKHSDTRAATDSLPHKAGHLVPARAHQDSGEAVFHQGHRPSTPAAPRRRPEQHGGGTGVTIYRNVMNNIEQLLERDQYREQDEPPNNLHPKRAADHDDAHLAHLEQQLQQFGLSFLEPRALHARGAQRGNNQAPPRPGAEPPLPLYRGNSAATPRAADELNGHTSAPREFSVATEEFLRKNGLMQP